MSDDGGQATPTATPAAVYGIMVGTDGVVIGAAQSNVAQPGMTAVSTDVFVAVLALGIGRCTYDGKAVAAYAPPPVPAPPPTVTGNQWAFALGDLGLSSAWQVGVAKSKAKDHIRIGLVARDTPLLASDPLLIRVADNAGTADGTAGGSPLIDVPTVFSRARDMPL